MPVIKESSGPGRPQSYPWEKWWKKKRFTLKKGRDFDIQLHSMAQSVRNRATIDGVGRVSVKINEDSISVEVI